PGRGGPSRVRAWAFGVLAQLARAAAGLRQESSRDRNGPARVRSFADARRAHYDLRVCAHRGRAAPSARGERGDTGGQLDGWVRLDGASDRVPPARGGPRACVTGR